MAADEALASKLITSPWQANNGTLLPKVAAAVGGSQGWKQVVAAAKTPVPVPLLVKTKVRQPVGLAKEAEMIPGESFPVHVPMRGSDVELPS